MSLTCCGLACLNFSSTNSPPNASSVSSLILILSLLPVKLCVASCTALLVIAFLGVSLAIQKLPFFQLSPTVPELVFDPLFKILLCGTRYPLFKFFVLNNSGPKTPKSFFNLSFMPIKNALFSIYCLISSGGTPGLKRTPF